VLLGTFFTKTFFSEQGKGITWDVDDGRRIPPPTEEGKKEDFIYCEKGVTYPSNVGTGKKGESASSSFPY